MKVVPEVLEFAVPTGIWIGLAVLGWWLFDQESLWRAFAGAGIAGYVWGWLVGSRPLRKMRRDWVQEANTLTEAWRAGRW